jgi:hypothetical protein
MRFSPALSKILPELALVSVRIARDIRYERADVGGSCRGGISVYLSSVRPGRSSSSCAATYFEAGQQFEAALFRAVVADPIVHRAMIEVVQLLQPHDLLHEPHIIERIEAASTKTLARKV